MSKKLWEFSQMSDVLQAEYLIKNVVHFNGTHVGERILATFRRLRQLDRKKPAVPEGRKARWTYSRCAEIWYRKARRIDAWQMDALRAAQREQQLNEAKNDYRELADRVARLETALAVSDENFHREFLDALRETHGRGHRSIGALDSPGAEGET